MKNRIGKISIVLLFTVAILLLVGNLFVSTAPATPVGNVKEDTVAILANQNGTGALIPGQTYVVTSGSASVAASTVNLFDVLGGAIEIISMFGACEVDMASSPGALNLEIDATVGDFDADFTTAVNVDALNKGDIIQFAEVTSGEAVLVPTTGVNAGLPVSWYCPVGMIEQATASTGTGSVIWVMTFRTLTTGVTVTAQ